MAGKNVVEITDENFEQEVIKSEVPVLVDFWAEWCAPCKAMLPAIDSVANDFAGKVKVGKLNIDDNPMSGGKFGIQAIPTLMIFKGGKVVRTMVGAQSKKQLEAALNAP